MLEPVICIYSIKNNLNGKYYIGQTSNYAERVRNHKSMLVRNRHFNSHLQRSWNKYGSKWFLFNIVEMCDIELLNELEQHYIEQYKSFHDDGGYNLNTGGAKNRKHSEYVRRKMSEKAKGRVFSEIHRARIGLANLGRKMSRESVEKVRKTKEQRMSQWGEKNGNALISDKEAAAIILDMFNGSTYLEIYQKYGISDYLFYKLKGNRSYKHILPEIRDSLRQDHKSREVTKKAVELYVGGMSQNAISQKLKISRNTIARELKMRGINTQAHKNQFIREKVVVGNAV